MGGMESLSFPWRGQKSERKHKVLGAVGLNPDENHSKPVLTSVLRSGIDGMFPESCDTGDKIPATGSSQTPDSWSSANS